MRDFDRQELLVDDNDMISGMKLPESEGGVRRYLLEAVDVQNWAKPKRVRVRQEKLHMVSKHHIIPHHHRANRAEPADVYAFAKLSVCLTELRHESDVDIVANVIEDSTVDGMAEIKPHHTGFG